MHPILTSIIASTVLASIISSIVAYRLKSLDFRNEYYKIILNKRLDSYKPVEYVVVLLQTIEYSYKGEPFHSSLTGRNHMSEFHEAVNNALLQSIWISTKTLIAIKNINAFLLSTSLDATANLDDDYFQFGIKNFKALEALKLKLEESCRHDILHLHTLT
jgi:hypothetical protein